MMTTIRALIVDYSTSTTKSPAATVEADRDQIGKAIRQGGRAVWLDVVEDDSATDTTVTRDWLAQALKIPRVIFERTLPFCDDTQILALGFAVPVTNRREGAGGQTLLSTWIVVRGAVLLTVHPSAFAGWNTIFDAAQTNPPEWQTSFTSTLYPLIKTLVDNTEQAIDFSSSQYNAMRADVFTEQSTPNYADMAIPVYRWQSNVAVLHDQLAPAAAAFSRLYAILSTNESDSAAIWPFMTLCSRLENSQAKLTRAFADAQRLSRLLDTLPSGTQTKTTTALIDQIKALDSRVQRFSLIAWTAIALLVGILAAGMILVLRGH